MTLLISSKELSQDHRPFVEVTLPTVSLPSSAAPLLVLTSGSSGSGIPFSNQYMCHLEGHCTSRTLPSDSSNSGYEQLLELVMKV